MESMIDSSSSEHIQDILRAASKHDNETLQKYLDTYSFLECSPPDVLDPDYRRCPLHEAIASCSSKEGKEVNGESNADETDSARLDLAHETVQLLLENGAIWNQLDTQNETPGCLARRLGLDSLYQLMIDAGVRAEMLLNRLEGYQELDDEDEEQDENEDVDENNRENDEVNGSATEVDLVQNSAVVEPTGQDVNSSDYLSSALSFTKDKLLDDQQNGVMMEWERDIMKQSAGSVVIKPGLKILNIGAGMLIFDSIVQASENRPKSHHIIEAHPDVLANMKASGWLDKPGVTVHAGKWQDVLPILVADGEVFDAIYFDTFAESYSDFREFFSEHVIGLLSQDGRWSFFNGMGADRQISYDVYQKVVEMDFYESGFDVEWQDIALPMLDKEWEGVRRKYWDIETYRLPVCKFMD